ncbi:biotin transporter BioY [Pelagibacterales bacterium SAG-MED13]|nr:biotin transporter BioY [Pelagibacterales bacterium SAG-MED13]|tara:strand:- start:554 stop:1105 length:552 start_codon:yes stop_codon:yes gene_type:complete
MEVIKQNTHSGIIKSLIIIFLGSIALIISAKIKIPFYPVPMTMQTFIVLLLGLSFGYKIGLASICLYLFEGIIGLPVFSNSPERGVGLIYFMGPTMGYLIGFLLASFFASKVKKEDNYFLIFIKLTLSVSIIYFMGVLWLGFILGWDKPLFQLGVEPFLLAELFKLALITALAKKLLKFRKFI